MDGTMLKGALEVIPFSLFIFSPSLQEGLGQNIAFPTEFKRKMDDYTSQWRRCCNLTSGRNPVAGQAPAPA